MYEQYPDVRRRTDISVRLTLRVLDEDDTVKVALY
jgi:hypothetical protein